MGLKNKIIMYGGAAIIFGSSILGGLKATSQLKTFDHSYWQQEIAEEKDKRLSALDKISELESDGIYSVDDLAKINDGILSSVRYFNDMDLGEGDLKAYDAIFSPGDSIMGDLNVKYSQRRFNNEENVALLAELGELHNARRSVDLSNSSLDERVNAKIQEIREVYEDPDLHREDLDSANYRTTSRWMIAGSSAGFLLGTGLSLAGAGVASRFRNSSKED